MNVQAITLEFDEKFKILKNLEEFMSQLELFFTFSFVSTVAVFFITTSYHFLPTLIALYRIFVRQQYRQIPSKYVLDDLKFNLANDEET